MTPDEFRENGHALIDWIAGYLEGIEQYPVSPPMQPGDVRAMLPRPAPVMRFCIGNRTTELRHVEAARVLLQSLA